MLIALTACPLPSVKTLVICNTVFFGGALIAIVLLTIALRAGRIRSRAADPYASAFGDQPNLLRSFNGGER